MTSATTATPVARTDLTDPTTQAFTLLRVGFTVAPILAGIDKYTEWMADWSSYLWSGIDSVVPVSGDTLMLVVGVIEVLAGILVAVRPRLGGLVVAAWLAGIIVNLMLAGDVLDVALRDLGLLLGAVALSRMAKAREQVGRA